MKFVLQIRLCTNCVHILESRGFEYMYMIDMIQGIQMHEASAEYVGVSRIVV